MDSGTSSYAIGPFPTKRIAIGTGGIFLAVSGVNIVLWLAGGWSLALLAAIGAFVFGVMFAVGVWSLANRTAEAPPLAADADTLRLAMPAAKPLVLAWESLSEVRVERALLGHRVTVVPLDIDEALAPERVPRAATRRWRHNGRIVVGIGRRSIDTTTIVAALAELADGRCSVSQGA